MKTLSLLSTGSVCIALIGCSTAADPPGGTAGTSGSAAGSTGTAGSSQGTAGAQAVAGSNSGGSDTSGGASTTAGSSSGGASGSSTGGSTTGGSTTGGSSTGGATTGGSSTGGSTTGGSSTGGSATGGSATAGGTSMAGATGDINVTTWSNGLDGALLTYPCGSGSPNYDCNQPTPCNGVSASNQAAPVIKPAGNAATSWKVGGTVGTTYNVKLRVQGVVEVSWYHDGTRSAGTASIDVASTVPGANPAAKDLFQTGGTPLTWADQGNGFDYNQYELVVTPPTGAAAYYYLNSVIPTENPHTSGKTQHHSFEIDEQPTLKIPGGATVSLAVRDSNCVEIQNCGNNLGSNCQQGAISVPLTSSDPKPPASWNGKVTSGTGGNLGGQFVHFDVISVTVAP